MSAAIGKKLQQAREEQGLTLEQVAAETHIRLHYLKAMEAGQFDSIPSRVQARGFLRYYASHLKLDVEPLFAALEGDAVLTLVAADQQDQSQLESVAETSPTSTAKNDPALASVGETLKAQREVLGLSLEDVERHTHLRSHYLQALERGDMAALPSSVQGSGMLKNYAEFLSLDPEPMLLRFADDLQDQLRQRQQPQRRHVQKEPRQSPGLIRRMFSKDILLGGFLVIFLMVFAIWAGLRISAARSSEEQQPTPPSIADVLLPSATTTENPTATATLPSPIDEAAEVETEAEAAAAPNEPEATQVALDLAFAESAVRVQIVIRQRTYMRINIDGEEEFNGRVIPGAAYAFAGEKSVEILTGNGAGLYVTYNDVELGLLGTFGEVRDIVLTIDGLQTPTPTISPTPTRTPRTTATATPSSTPNP